MLEKKPIDQFLPVRFKHGNTVKQFSKPCIRCGQVLQAHQMHGIMRLLDDHIALAAEATCNHCQTRFGVACVIDSEKRVRRVVVPAVLFGWYLRALPPQPGEMGPENTPSGENPTTITPPPQSSAAPSLPQATTAAAPAAKDYPRASTSVGQYQGKPIPAYIIVAGREIPFDHIAFDGKVGRDEYLIDGLFIYKVHKS